MLSQSVVVQNCFSTSMTSKSVLFLQVGTLRQALQIKASELSKQAGADIHSRLLYAVAKVCFCRCVFLANLTDKSCFSFGVACVRHNDLLICLAAAAAAELSAMPCIGGHVMPHL